MAGGNTDDCGNTDRGNADHCGTLLNFSHLDHLSEEISRGSETLRIVHIYCEAPDYRCCADPEEGTSCVDDVARAAVMYLRHFELTGDDVSRNKAEQMLRFILYMQTPGGLFFNFVIDRDLNINRTHIRSRAEKLEWWTARAVWALATAARAFREANPRFAEECAEAAWRVLPHVCRLLENYPKTVKYHCRQVPTWLLYGDGADATSELLLGLVPLSRLRPSRSLHEMIGRLCEGIALMRYGSMNRFPFGLHASNRHEWHKWGNSQTQALAEAGLVDVARLEADQFYPRLLVEGWLHSITFDQLHGVRYYERISYGVRSVAVGLIRLYQLTGEVKYARMAGLAASWFFGNNSARTAMYDADTGRCYDGLNSPSQVNYNSGAESTVEALHTILEVEAVPEARAWLKVEPEPPVVVSHGGEDYFFRVFRRLEHPPASIGVIMNLTSERVEVLTGTNLDEFLSTRSV